MPNHRLGRVRIKCMGSKTDLNPKDHWFWTLNRITQRYCDACNKKKDRIFVPIQVHDFTEDDTWTGFMSRF